MPHRFAASILSLLMATGLLTAPAHGLVVENQQINNTAPGDDPGFDYVGRIGNGSGNSAVYLGFANGFNWALTAHHNNNANNFNFNGHSLAQLSSQRIGGGSTDLRLIKLDGGNLGMGKLDIRAAAVTSGTALTLVGHGRAAAGPEQDLDTDPGAANELLGFDWTGTGTRPKLWGTNTAIALGDPIVLDTLAFAADFTDGIVNEATLADKDSGSAAFIKNGGTWELAGIGYTIDQVEDPGRTDTSSSAYGDESFFVDLSQYRTELLAAMVPEPGSLTLLCGTGAALLVRRRRAN